MSKKKETTHHPKSTKGQPIASAKEKFDLVVKREHVRGSVVGEPENCAAARCLKEQTHVVRAWVTRTRTIVQFNKHPIYGSKLVRWANPKALRNGVDKYDNSAGVFPEGKYELVPVPPSHRTPSKGKRRDGSRPHLSRNRSSVGMR